MVICHFKLLGVSTKGKHQACRSSVIYCTSSKTTLKAHDRKQTLLKTLLSCYRKQTKTGPSACNHSK